MQPITLSEKFAQFQDHWNPRVIGELNEQYIKLAKLAGEFVWHHHAAEDELFVVVQGTLLMDFRDETVTVEPGQLLLVPRGTEHRPRVAPGEEVHVMLIEPKTTVNTGQLENERTRHHLETL